MFNIEKLAKIIPVGSLLLILASSIKHSIYFGFFGINITNYLEVQEYITLFIDDLLLYIIMFGIYIVVQLYRDLKKEKNEREIIPYKEMPKELKRIFWVLITVLVCVIVITAIFILNDKILSEKLSYLRLGTSIALSVFLLISIVKGWEFSYYSFALIVFVVYLVLDPLVDANKVVENGSQRSYCFQFSEKFIETDDDLQYLGSSANYVFLYSIENRTSRIISSESLVEIAVSIE